MSNTKHGWVTPRADGTKARCGGPAVCTTCQAEQMHEGVLTACFGAPAHQPPQVQEDQDGRALRLAIERHISIKQQYGRVTAKGKYSATVSFRNCGGDRFAATRLAIFRAAGVTPWSET